MTELKSIECPDCRRRMILTPREDMELKYSRKYVCTNKECAAIVYTDCF